MPRTSARNSSDRIEMSGFFEPRRGEDVDDPFRATACEMIWRTAWSSSSSAGLAGRPLREHRWARPGKTPRRRGCASASSWGTASAKAWDSSRPGVAAGSRSSAEDVLLGRRQRLQALLGRARPVQAEPVEPAHTARRLAAAAALLLLHAGRTASSGRWPRTVSAALGVGGERGFSRSARPR